MIKLKELFDTPKPDTTLDDLGFGVDAETFNLPDINGNMNQYAVAFIERSLEDMWPNVLNDQKYSKLYIYEVAFAVKQHGTEHYTPELVQNSQPFKVFTSVYKILENKMKQDKSAVGFMFSLAKLHNFKSREKLYVSFAKLISQKTHYIFVDTITMPEPRMNCDIFGYKFLYKDFYKQLQNDGISLKIQPI